MPMYHDNPRRSVPDLTRLTPAQYAAVKRGYKGRKITARTSWMYDLGAKIAAAGVTLEDGLFDRGYNPWRRAAESR